MIDSELGNTTPSHNLADEEVARLLTLNPIPNLEPPADLSMQVSEPRRRAGSEALIVHVGDQLIVFRDLGNWGVQGPRCVSARARSKQRCRQSVQSGGCYGGWSDWTIAGTGGNVSALEPGSIEDDAFLVQRCPNHYDADTPDVISPTWTLFDPVRDADFVSYHPVATWTPDGLRSITPGAPKETFVDDVDDPFAEMRKDYTLKAILERALLERVDPPFLTAVYRYYDADDLLLYIGITGDLAVREMSHIKDSSWMEFAARSTISRYPTRREAEQVEEAAIRAEGPLFNHRHNDSPEAVVRLVEYLIKHGRTDLLAPAVSRG